MMFSSAINSSKSAPASKTYTQHKNCHFLSLPLLQEMKSTVVLQFCCRYLPPQWFQCDLSKSMLHSTVTSTHTGFSKMRREHSTSASCNKPQSHVSKCQCHTTQSISDNEDFFEEVLNRCSDIVTCQVFKIGIVTSDTTSNIRFTWQVPGDVGVWLVGCWIHESVR